ncbi:MAG TPA: hypothetical protein VFY13_02520 [Luteolibacter sp.]|nr:hypothetical protein [Luteolibacter sp.]
MSLKSFVSGVSGALLGWLALAYVHPTTTPGPKSNPAVPLSHQAPRAAPADQAAEDTGLVVSGSPVTASHD